MKLFSFRFPATRTIAPTPCANNSFRKIHARTIAIASCETLFPAAALAQSLSTDVGPDATTDGIWPFLGGLGIIIAIVALLVALGFRRRLKSKESLIRRAELLAGIAAHSRDLLTVFDSTGTVIYQSPSLKDILGIEPDESVGKSYLETTLSTESKELVLHRLQLAVSGKLDNTDMEVMHERPDGQQVWLESRLHIARDASGSIEAIYSISRDITEKRQTDMALRESQRRFEMIAEHVTDVIQVYDSDGIAIYASPASYRVLGYRPDERVGTSYLDSPTTDQTGKAIASRMLAKINSGEFSEGTFEVQLRHRDGTEFTGQHSVRVRRDRNGETEEIYLLTRDISEQVENRRLLIEQKEKLEARTRLLLEVNRRLDRFSASVSHDLRGPIRRITRQLTALQDQDAAIGGKLQDVIDELREMDEMVAHLLDLAVDPDQPLQRKDVDMGSVALLEAQRIELETGREFTIAVPETGSAIASADHGLMQLLFSNLIRNACTHVSKDEPLKISVSCMQRDGETEYRVEDNGGGFNSTDPATLFEYSVRGIDDMATDGYGIGLATVSDIIQRHGGSIVAENSPGGGACIRFTLGE